MLVIYDDGTIGKTNTDKNVKVNIGDSLVFEFLKIHIVSDNFDYFGTSELLVINNIKLGHMKDKCVDIITYYDDSAKATSSGSLFSLKHYSIGPFDPSKFGDSIFYNTPGYQGGDITITTKFMELDDHSDFNKYVVPALGGVLSAIPVGTAYVTLAKNIVTNMSSLIHNTQKLLVPVSILKVTQDTLYTGKYIFFPTLSVVDVRNLLKQKISVDMDTMTLLIEKNGIVSEINTSYFIISISNEPRSDLTNFDYAAVSSDIMSKLNTSNSNDVTTMINVTKDSFNMQTLDDMYDSYIKGDTDMINALYKHITPDKQQWFNSFFSNIASKIKSN